jgi:hypothetical protein
MKKQFLFFTVLFLSFTAISQEITKQREVGLIFNNLDNFGITYRTGTNAALWRFNTMVLTGSVIKPNTFDPDTKRKESVFGYSFSLGREKRNLVSENFELRYGLELFTNYAHNRRIQEIGNNKPLEKTLSRSLGLSFVLGVNYVLNDYFAFGAELLPSVSYSKSKRIENTNLNNEFIENTETLLSEGYSYGFSNTSARLSIIYRF